MSQTPEELSKTTNKLVALNLQILMKYQQRIALQEALSELQREIPKLLEQRAEACSKLKQIPGYLKELLTPPEFSIPIEELGFTKRTLRGLLDSSIRTLGDILDYSELKILQLNRNLGRRSLEEIKAVVKVFGFSLKKVIILK